MLLITFTKYKKTIKSIMKHPITFICAQPCTIYYAWQVEVMLTNFRNLRLYEHYDIHCVWAYNKNIPSQQKEVELIIKLDDKFEDIAKFFYYEDTRVNPSYISSIRFNVLKQHFAEMHGSIHNTVFYHDCDIVFTKFPDYLPDMIDTNDWYVTDTRHYLGYNYVVSKGQDVLEKMCEIVDISPEIVKEKEMQAGGAQYVLKNMTPKFFEEAEHLSNILYKEITELNHHKVAKNPEYHPIQIWAADMWVMVWQAWKKGINTIISEKMSMALATDDIKKWNQVSIYHNAGITEDLSATNFFKANYRHTFPYNNIEPETYDKTKTSYLYALIVDNVGKNSCYMPAEKPMSKYDKAKEIAQAFATKLNPTEEQKMIATIRISTCMGCEFWKENIFGIHYCEKCGCATSAKVYSDKGASSCPENKWTI